MWPCVRKEINSRIKKSTPQLEKRLNYRDMLQNSFSTFDLDQPNLEGSFLPDQEFFHWPVPSQSSFSPLFTNARRLSKPIFSVGAREDRWAYHHEQRTETRRDTRREERRGKEEERERERERATTNHSHNYATEFPECPVLRIRP